MANEQNETIQAIDCEGCCRKVESNDQELMIANHSGELYFSSSEISNMEKRSKLFTRRSSNFIIN